MKRGFTLIELIGIVILLSLISLICFPIILNTIKNTKIELSEANREVIYSGASNYITKYQNMFKKTSGNIYCITLKDLVIEDMAPSIIHDKNLSLSTYVKVEVVNEQYQYSLEETCSPQINLPDIVLSVVGTPFNDKGWASDNFYVNIVGTGHSYKYCISDTTCTPDILVNASRGTAYVTNNSITNYVCAQAIGNEMNSRVVCSEPFKLDKQSPTIEPQVPYYVVVTPNTNISSIEYFNYQKNGLSDISNTFCDISNTSTLSLGEHTVTCTTTKENGKSATASKTIDVSNCFEFESDTGTITNYNCYSGNTGGYLVKSDAKIPYSINNTGVEIIAAYYGGGSFHDKNLTSVDFSNAIQLKVIDSGAFSYNELATLNLSSLVNLEAIYCYVFENNQLNSVNFNNLSKLNHIGYQSFRNNQLTNVDLNDMINLHFLEEEVFENNDLTSIDIPNNIKEIYSNAFANNRLESVTIPSSITRLDRGSFYKTSSSNKGLTQIINQTGRSFDWGKIVNGSSSATNYNFVTGTIVNSYGNVEVTN